MTPPKPNSALALDPSVFDPASIDSSTHKLNATLKEQFETAPKWYEVGIAQYRDMIYQGKTHFRPPTLLPRAHDVVVPSRDENRGIPLRVYEPDGVEPSEWRGVFMYLHGGGFVLGSHVDSDNLLKSWSNTHNLVTLSVGYRLAPESPFPAGVQDCIDVAEYLVDHSASVLNIRSKAPLRVIAGGSAGANFAALTAIHLMKSRPGFRLDALWLSNGIYDLTLGLPSAVNARGKKGVAIDSEMAERMVSAYASSASLEDRRKPDMSPLCADLQTLARESKFGSLPPVLLTVGTADMLLDDSVMMAVKWMATGSEAVLKCYPGAPHMFSAFRGYKVADDCAEDVQAWLEGKLDVETKS